MHRPHPNVGGLVEDQALTQTILTNAARLAHVGGRTYTTSVCMPNGPMRNK